MESSTETCKVRWSPIIPDDRLKFIIKVVNYDLLPTPANKNVWYGGEERCQLCGKNGTLSDILSVCNVALSKARYKWRHDKVLKELSCSIQSMINANFKIENTQRRKIGFVREGDKGEKKNAQAENYVHIILIHYIIHVYHCI